MTETLDLTEFASRIIHPLVRTLDSTPELRHAVMETISSLVTQLGRKFQIFIPMVNKVLVKHKLTHQRYDVLVCKIVKVRKFISEVSRITYTCKTRILQFLYYSFLKLYITMLGSSVLPNIFVFC